eukprot:IDg2979t1
MYVVRRIGVERTYSAEVHVSYSSLSENLNDFETDSDIGLRCWLLDLSALLIQKLEKGRTFAGAILVLSITRSPYFHASGDVDVPALQSQNCSAFERVPMPWRRLASKRFFIARQQAATLRRCRKIASILHSALPFSSGKLHRNV